MVMGAADGDGGRVMVMGCRADVDMHRLLPVDPAHPTQFVNVAALMPRQGAAPASRDNGEDVRDEAEPESQHRRTWHRAPAMCVSCVSRLDILRAEGSCGSIRFADARAN